MTRPISFGVVTPTYQRPEMLRAFIRRVCAQAHRDWRLHVVHDGASEATRRLVEEFARRDPRVDYCETPARSNDYGITPRLVGIAACNRAPSPDYVVLWDDDNRFYPRALADLARAIEELGRPPVVLAPIHRRGVILPIRPDVGSLGRGDVDTANLVVSAGVAGAVYPAVAETARSRGDAYHSDALFFEALRSDLPEGAIRVAGCRPIGLYDGLRTPVWLTHHLRRSLHLPPLNLSRFAWYRRAMERASRDR